MAGTNNPSGMNPDAGTNKYAYSTYGGCDIQAMIGSDVIFNLQAISYAVTREKAPIYTMGSAAPRSFGRGKRGIAGSAVLTQFDQHGMMGIWEKAKFAADSTEQAPWGEGTPPVMQGQTAEGAEAMTGLWGAQSAFQNETDDWNMGVTPKSPWYMDQLLPCDITVYAANEYGSTSVLRIYGVEWLNEGWGISVDDMVSEMQSTWVAIAIHPWARITNAYAGDLGTPPTTQS